ncbi:MAG: protein-disulfide reductase DsbD domain-containing protein [Terracidiphilus sp.]
MRWIAGAVAALAIAAAVAAAQIGTPETPLNSLLGTAKVPAQHPAAVRYLYPEQVSLPAGKPVTVALHFRVAPGLHINSHTPRGEFLIPTTVAIPDGAGVRLAGADYPPGTEYRPPEDRKTRLRVYAGEFVIRARLVAEAGDHLVELRLRYQACAYNTCMPPRTILAAIDVIGK